MGPVLPMQTVRLQLLLVFLGFWVQKREIQFTMNQSFRALRDITSSYDTPFFPWDWSPRHGNIIVKKDKKAGVKCVCIYVRGHLINDYKLWKLTNIGKTISAYIDRARFKNHLKCLIFDSWVENHIFLDVDYVDYFMEVVMDDVHHRGDKENLPIYSRCEAQDCTNYTTFNFTNDWNMNMRHDMRFCPSCYELYMIYDDFF